MDSENSSKKAVALAFGKAISIIALIYLFLAIYSLTAIPVDFPQNGQGLPTATFDYDYNDSTTNPQFQDHFDGSGKSTNWDDEALGTDGLLTITHTGGDKIAGARITITDGERTSPSLDDAGVTSITAISMGDEFTIAIDSDDTVDIIFTTEGQETSNTLSTWEGPDA